MLPYFHRIACKIGCHSFVILRNLSERACHVECYYCKRQFALKMSGACAGNAIPWEEAKSFYTDERIERVLNEKY